MQQIAYSVALTFNSLPLFYRFILRYFIILTLAVTICRLYICPNHTSFLSIVKTIEFKNREINFLLPKINKSINQSVQELKYKLNDRSINKISTYKCEYVISLDNILSNNLNQYNINVRNTNRLFTIEKYLHKLKVNKQLFRTLITDTDLQNLNWEMSYCKTSTYNHKSMGNSFKIGSELQRGDWVNRVMKGTIEGNFFASAREAGLTSSEISAVIEAMQWQIDFRKLKKGDQFSVLMSKEILNGEREQNQLVGIHLRSGSKDYYAIRAEDGKFYDRDGISLAEGFLRFPTVKQFRISSNFNLHRLNPITGRVMPHRGIDFAMPQGTPVLAVADGEVVTARRSGTAGFFIVVRHSQTYTTRYMHLCKILVKPGQKVKRGDHIALSGNTGRSTGPHLHYEMWINQQAVNPLNVRLPCIEELTGKNRCNYLAQVKEVIPHLCFD